MPYMQEGPNLKQAHLALSPSSFTWRQESVCMCVHVCTYPEAHEDIGCVQPPSSAAVQDMPIMPTNPVRLNSQRFFSL